jgi:hypothetical protein
MRQGQQNKRMRGRNRKGPNPLTRSFESNGPDVKIRGTALHIAEKYVQLARDAQASGDRVAGENYLQHAEHYYRIVAAAQAQMPQPQQIFRSDDEEGDEEEERSNGYGERQPQQQGVQPNFGLSDPQPYVNGNGQGRPEGDGSAAASDDNRFEGREQRDYREGRDHFRRRRRPYRDRFGGEQGEQRGNEPAGQAQAAPSED